MGVGEGIIEQFTRPTKDEPSIAFWTRMVIRERFPEALEVSIDEVEITGDSAYVSASLKMPSQYPSTIEIKITEQKPNDEQQR